MYHYPENDGAQRIVDELNRTGVISNDFKNQLLSHLNYAIRLAREKGKKDAEAKIKKMAKKKVTKKI